MYDGADMYKKIRLIASRFLYDIYDWFQMIMNKGSRQESVYFYTFHKCASTLFGGYVLKNIDDLHQVDYSYHIYIGKKPRIRFEKFGHVYGPLRLSALQLPSIPLETHLIETVSNPEFISDKIAVFLIRDPRDILVSSYYSYGFTHSISDVPETREVQIKVREIVQGMTVDEFALASVESMLRNFEKIDELNNACVKSVVIRYEDMINDFDNFITGFTKYLSLSQSVIQTIYERSRPRQSIDNASHRRSGKAGMFRHELKMETVDILNAKLAAILAKFNYSA